MSHNAARNPAPPPPTGDNDAVWMLLLPACRRILFHAESPPAALVRELVKRGAHVDVVSRCNLASWLEVAPGAARGRLRCLWEPDADVEYDFAVLWNPRGTIQVTRWLRSLAALRLVPRDIAVWSRNPLLHRPAPHWPLLDLELRRAGFRLEEAQLALPEPGRVRQIVEWRQYGHTPLLVHRRTHRPWKSWIARQTPYRWLQPARFRRATLADVTSQSSRLAEIVSDASGDRDTRLERLLVSPNAVAIAALRLHEGSEPRDAILKIPYTLAAEARVARNAAGLEWMEIHATSLERWAGVAPRLLKRGRSQDCSWTLEERVTGVEAQSWPDAASEVALQQLASFLEALQRHGEPARRPDDATLERLLGAPLRAVASLLDAPLAQRLHDLAAELLQTLRGVRLPLVPRHGDLKLENVLGDAARPEALRILDWELFVTRGLPLLDLWHLIASRRARAAGCSMGAAVRRWLLPGDLNEIERGLVQRLARDLDPRYVEVSPVLHWLDRIGPMAARGGWPAPGWEQSNVVQVLEGLQMVSEVRR